MARCNDIRKTEGGIVYKRCSLCHRWLPLDKDFHKFAQQPDGHQYYCKECKHDYSANHYKGGKQNGSKNKD